MAGLAAAVAVTATAGTTEATGTAGTAGGALAGKVAVLATVVAGLGLAGLGALCCQYCLSSQHGKEDFATREGEPLRKHEQLGKGRACEEESGEAWEKD